MTEQANAAGAAAGWRVLRGSARGTSHAQTGAPCQDASDVMLYDLSGEEVAVLACADGAGSARLSHEGAQLACAAVIGEACDFLDRRGVDAIDRATVEGWYAGVHAAVADRAAELGATARDLACTLLLAVVGERRAVFAQIGDGAMVVDDGTPDGYAPAFWPQSGEYANTTYFATEPEALRHLQFAAVEGRRVEEVALFSDGLQPLALRYEERAAHAPFFRPMFGRLRPLAADDAARLEPGLLAFLDSAPVNARTDDDKTLVLATRRPPAAVPPAPAALGAAAGTAE
jgi:hypothetical protein